MSDYKRITMKDEEYGNYVQNIGSELNKPKIAVSYNGKIHGTIIDRLAELEDKIENGTLREFPCKVGDTIYLIELSEIRPARVSEINLSFSGNMIVVDLIFSGFILNRNRAVFLSQFGKTVFLTEVEAKAKLKEIKEEVWNSKKK